MAAIGQTISRYCILSKIGEGGMGVVFKAEDVKLKRPVALKFLPSDSTEHRERFLREAQAAASLNHPNICIIHEIDEEHGFIAMELIEGPSVKEKIDARPLPLEEALNIAIQACTALQAAHEKGIVHRDIKPANLMLTAQGQVKVMDFGLAQIGDRTRLTKTGAFVGTPAYMSPEQTQGQPADRRTDIWAVGVALFEMLTGCPPFVGQTDQALSFGIVHTQPEPVTALRSGLPVELDRILAKALAKSPAERYQNIADLIVDLRSVATSRQPSRRQLVVDLHHPVRETAALPGSPQSMRTTALFRAAYAGAGAAASVALLAGLWQLPLVRNRLTVFEPSLRADARIIQLTNYSGTERESAISPDGKYFAFVSDRGGSPDIWVRQISGGEPVQITHDPAVESGLVYAKDGETIYFAAVRGAGSSIWQVGTLGGTPRKVVESGRSPSPSPDGRHIAYLRGGSIHISDVQGGAPREIIKAQGLGEVRWSPDGRWLAYISGVLFDTSQIHIIDTEGKNGRQVTNFEFGTTLDLAWLPDSRELLFSRQYEIGAGAPADIGAVSIQSGRLRRLTLNAQGNFRALRLSADGRKLVATLTPEEHELWKAPVTRDPKSNAAQAERLADRSEDPAFAHLGPSGLLLFNSKASGVRNLWIKRLEEAGARQVTFFPRSLVTHAALSPDGSKVAYASLATGTGQVWVATVDGSAARQLTSDKTQHYWPSWSRDGTSIIFSSQQAGGWELWNVPAAGGQAVRLLPDVATGGDWSPIDDRIAYTSKGVLEIAAAATGKVLLSQAPAAGIPMWSPDAKRLSTVSGNSVWIFDSRTAERRLAVEFPKEFRLEFRASWTRDGNSVVVTRHISGPSNIFLLENF